MARKKKKPRRRKSETQLMAEAVADYKDAVAQALYEVQDAVPDERMHPLVMREWDKLSTKSKKLLRKKLAAAITAVYEANSVLEQADEVASMIEAGYPAEIE